MARRVSWTNNSSGHSGTYVFRAESLDPQNLPAPVATVDPVAQGDTAEWIDNSGEYGCFAVQDFDEQGVGALSADVCVTDPWENAQIGDEVEGAIYAGTITYADSREYHLLFAKQAGESSGIEWGNDLVVTNATDPDDGLANQELVLSSFDNGDSFPFYHCRDYVDGEGNNDYYVPSRNEISKVDALVSMSHPEFVANLSDARWSSTESSSRYVWTRRFSDGFLDDRIKFDTAVRVRPVRRVAA